MTNLQIAIVTVWFVVAGLLIGVQVNEIASLEAKVDYLTETQAEVEILNEQVNTLSGQVMEIAKIQNDILRQTIEEEVKR